MLRLSQSSRKRWLGPQATLLAVLVVFTVVAVWYSVAVPVGEGVDEVAHFDYVRYVKDHWALPVQPWRDNERPLQVWMGHHPPLYYVLGAVLSFWSDTTDFSTVLVPNPHFIWAENDPVNGWNVFLHSSAEKFPYKGTILAIHYLRLWSVLMGVVTVLAVYQMGRLVLPGQPWIAITAATLIAFNPSFVFMSSTVHHDPLMAMIYTLSLWWMVRALCQRPAVCDALLGGLLLGVGLLTKLSGLSLIPLFALTLLLAAWRERDWGRALRCGASLYGMALLVAGWWYLRNQMLYDDPLGWQMFLNIHQHMVRYGPYTWFIFYHEFLGQLSRTFWGAFGYMHITLPPTIWRSFWGLTGISALAAVVAGIRNRWALLADGRWRYLLMLLSAAALVFLSFFRFSVATVGAGHGRYLFTIAAPFSLILAVGLNSLAGFRAQRWVAGVVGIGMLFYAVVVPLHFVFPLYAAPETAKSSDLTSVSQAEILFGDALELVAYEFEPDAVSPGGSFSLALYWRATGQERPDLFVRIRLRDRFGNAFVDDEFWPVASSSTAVWDTATIYVTRRTLSIPPNAATGRSPLEVLVQPGRNGSPLSARGPTGEVLGRAPRVASLLVGQASIAEPSEVSARHPRREILGGTIALLGYDIASARVRPGETVMLTLYWQATQGVDGNFTVFVHVLNEEGQVMAQQDNEPNGGQYPTSAWVPGEVIRDTYAIPLPPELPSGRYLLSIGMYAWPSLKRLPVTLDGAKQGDTIALDFILVER